MVVYAVDQAKDTPDIPLRDRLESLQGVLAKCHSVIDGWDGLANSPDAASRASSPGVFSLSESSLGSANDLLARISKIAERVGSL